MIMAHDSSRGPVWGRMAIATASLAICFVAIELALRVLGVQAEPRLLMDRSRQFFVPEVARQHPWAMGVTNALRVAVVGDSFTWGQGVQSVDRYAEHLEWLLNLNNGVRPARVSVWAQCGTSTYQQLRLLRQALDQGADLVILGICLNDTEDWKDPRTLMQWRKQWHREPWRWARWSYLLTWIHNRLETVRVNRAYRTYYAHLYDPTYVGWQRFTEAIHDFKTTCDSNHVRLVTAVFPLMDNLGTREYPFGPMHTAIAGVMKKEGIDSIDLLDAFLGGNRDRLQVIPGVDPHPDEIAHRLMAECIFDYLLEAKTIDESYCPRAHGQMNTQLAWKKEIDALRNQ